MKEIFNTILDLLYPKKQTCILCGRDSSKTVCEHCLGGIKFINGKICLKCGKGMNNFYNELYCPDCLANVYYFESAFSCFEYEGIGKALIHKLKYEGKKELANVLARLMYYRIKDESILPEAIIPVPIHDMKLEKRGFNQSLLIAEQLGRHLKIPVLDCMKRIKDTKEQFNLNRYQRLVNVIDAFSMDLRYNNSKLNTILLLDDIYTTGSTVNECSKALKQTDIQNIYVITAAAGSNT